MNQHTSKAGTLNSFRLNPKTPPQLYHKEQFNCYWTKRASPTIYNFQESFIPQPLHPQFPSHNLTYNRVPPAPHAMGLIPACEWETRACSVTATEYRRRLPPPPAATSLMLGTPCFDAGRLQYRRVSKVWGRHASSTEFRVLNSGRKLKLGKFLNSHALSHSHASATWSSPFTAVAAPTLLAPIGARWAVDSLPCSPTPSCPGGVGLVASVPAADCAHTADAVLPPELHVYHAAP